MSLRKINILFLLFIIACSSTRITKDSTLPNIVRGESILLMNIKNLNELQGYDLFESMKGFMSGTNNVKYLLAEEYYLIQKGIGKEHLYLDQVADSIISIIAKESNCRYILYVEVLKSKKGGAFGSYTALELDHNSRYNTDNETNTAHLLFEILDTQSDVIENTFQVNTKINPLIINEGGGETRINATTELTAITKAFEKGIRQLKKGVVENSNKIR